MDSIPKFMASVITIIIGVVMCISFIISAVVVNSARTYHSSVIDQIEASSFEEATIEKCVKNAKDNKYALTVEKTSSPESDPTSLYKVTLNYGLYAPIFGKIHNGKLVGYALAGAKIGDGSNGGAADIIAPGLYETGSNYTKLLKSWEELVSDSVVGVSEGVVSTGYTSGDNASSDSLAGDLMLPFDGSIKEIGNLAFFKCKKLTGVKIPDSVKIIGEQAFDSCQELSSVELAKGIERIDYSAFNYDGNIAAVIYNGTIEDWCKISFDSKQSNPVYYGASLFVNGEKIEHLMLPIAEITSIEYKFTGCGSLLSATIPEHVPGINMLTEIPDNAFALCNNLTFASIGSGVTRIGQYAFLETNLTSVSIPSTVTEIDSYAFYYCRHLTDINFKGTMAQWNSINFGSDWDCETGTYTIHCNDGNIAKS